MKSNRSMIQMLNLDLVFIGCLSLHARTVHSHIQPTCSVRLLYLRHVQYNIKLLYIKEGYKDILPLFPNFLDLSEA